jgi:hypothetical protein
MGGHITAIAAVLITAAGCYGRGDATGYTNEAWRGHTRAAIEASWGPPAAVTTAQGDTFLAWSHTTRHVELPSAEAELTIEPGHVEAYAAVRPGRVIDGSTTTVTARIDATGRIVSVSGPSLYRWRPPDDANLRWGLIMGLSAGMGRLDDTSTALPGGGAYLGGMLSRTLGLVGTFHLASGTDDDGGAMGLAWGMAAQHWPATRLSVRGGAALVLAWDPGFEDVSLGPGVTGAVSYALVKAGAFVLDLRLDLVVGPAVAFGTAGVGVNLN